jgi:hypothetical protein
MHIARCSSITAVALVYNLVYGIGSCRILLDIMLLLISYYTQRNNIE